MVVSGRAKLGTFSSYVGLPLLALLALDVLVVLAYVFGRWTWLSLPDVPLSIFGGVIGVFAGFRNTSAYARWWEARTIWGSVVNNSRNLAREVLTMITSPATDSDSQREIEEVKRGLVLLEIAYVHALRNHLRGTAPWPELAGLVSEQETERLRTRGNVPLAIQQSMAATLTRCYLHRWIDEIRWASLDRTLSTIMDCQGASERIKNTPFPRVYDSFIRLIITIFCVLLPFGMVAGLRLWTPLGSTLVGFIFLAFDKIGRDLEAPFENLPHDIPLTAISRTIEINLKQMIGEEDLPEPPAAVDGILW
jgi:ion channel-forming bestrophin family protein